MSNFKSFAMAAILGLATLGASAATTAITLTPVGKGDLAADFSGYAASNTFTFDLTGFGALTNFVSSLDAKVLGVGYDITSATFDSVAFNADTNKGQGTLSSKDSWTLQLTSLSAGLHTLVVNGVAVGGSTAGFSGSVYMTSKPVVLTLVTAAVPEPETFAMLLAGLGLMGVIARRRKQVTNAI